MNYYFALVENMRTTVSQSVGVGTSDVDEERVAKKNVKNFIPSTTGRHKTSHFSSQDPYRFKYLPMHAAGL